MNRDVADAARRLDRALDDIPRNINEDDEVLDLNEVYAATEDLFAELRRAGVIPAAL